MLSDEGVPNEQIADLLGHTSTRHGRGTYRHRLRPVVARSPLVRPGRRRRGKPLTLAAEVLSLADATVRAWAQRWVHGSCRCERCRGAVVDYHRTYRAAQVLRRGGEPATRWRPNLAAAHVDTLRAAGWTLQRIADAAGVSLGAGRQRGAA